MRIKFLNLPVCLLLLGISALVLLGTGSAAEYPKKPVWDRECSLTADTKTSQTLLKCGDYTENYGFGGNDTYFIKASTIAVKCQYFEKNRIPHTPKVVCNK